jgi:hypothetical protein
MKTIATLFVMLIAAFAAHAQQKSQYAPQIETLVKMFNERNAEIAAPVLAENYTISRLFPGMEEEILKQVLVQFPHFDGYTIKTETKEKNGTRLAVALQYKDEGTEKEYPANFLINADNKIQELNILETADIKMETK